MRVDADRQLRILTQQRAPLVTPLPGKRQQSITRLQISAVDVTLELAQSLKPLLKIAYLGLPADKVDATSTFSMLNALSPTPFEPA
ncbi:hypothetical protein GCM10022278_11410 [Allohahella marinimesophila]|uniref:Uncharacterized protein n=1 Tax=Allohahella marinimesophila TaxID=1054972 RepID=A0ABP7NUS7_9GAMM